MTPLKRAEGAARNELLRQGVLVNPESSDILGELDMAALVRAIIRTIRDPSGNMAEAGSEVIRNVRPLEFREAYVSDAAYTWRFMIDALLEDRSD